MHCRKLAAKQNFTQWEWRENRSQWEKKKNKGPESKRAVMVGLNVWWRDTQTADCTVYEVKGELSGVVILKICLQRSRICVEYSVTVLLLGLDVCSTAVCCRPDQPVQDFPGFSLWIFYFEAALFFFCCCCCCKGCDSLGASFFFFLQQNVQ